MRYLSRGFSVCAAFLALVSGAQAAEFEVVDKLSVEGAVTLSTSGAVRMPASLSADRPEAAVPGMVRFNTTTGRLEYYSGASWESLLGVSSTPVAAGGGDEVRELNGYRIHIFRVNSTFNVFRNITADILIVAGGGGGGSHSTTNANGGGGGGGVVYARNYALAPGNYTVTIGQGGVGYPWNVNARGTNGGDSTFQGITAAKGGGGGGGSGTTLDGIAGGSGGGAARRTDNGATGAGGASNQGGAGGNITVYGNAGAGNAIAWTGSGGGGAGGPGVAGNVGGATAGDGGPGIVFDISGDTVCYAGGGGGGGNSSEPAGDGFCGGGRGVSGTTYYDYRVYPDEVNPVTKGHGMPQGLKNTGGGGGAGSYWHGSAAGYLWMQGGSGGSGIVIVRYAIP